MPRHRLIGASVLVVFACVGGAAVRAQAGAETYVANASLKTAGGASVTAPVTVTITGWTSEAERGELRDRLKSGGHQALLTTLRGVKSVGTVTIGEQRFNARYAYAMPSGGGRLITVVTAEPIFFIGAGTPAARPRTGHDFGVVTFEVNDKGVGKGTLTPAASVKLGTGDAIVVEDYSAELVQLPDVRKK